MTVTEQSGLEQTRRAGRHREPPGRSSEQLSFDPVRQVDRDTPLDPGHHGTSPEWSTLYGTSYWAEIPRRSAGS